MSSKIVLIDGHSIFNRAFLWAAGSDECRGPSYKCNIWISNDYV